jgi:spoIIIJ-associated protein
MNNIEIETKFQDVIAQIVNGLGLTATIIVDTIESDGKKYLKVDLEGEELSVLIGHHGRTLAALKSVFSLVAPRQGEENYGVLLDVNQYHSKREDYIRNMSVSAIDQVRLTMQPMELMPMSPADRRIVHMVVKETEDITTESVGEEPDRRVVIKLKK